MLAAGLLARNAVAKGLRTQAVGEDVARARARRSSPTTSTRPACSAALDKLGFNIVGYGCTTCIGNSGPLPEPIADAIEDEQARRRGGALGQSQLRRAASIRSRASTISRRRRSSSRTRSPAAWTSTSTREPLGIGSDGPVFLRDIWPAPQEVEDEILRSVKRGACSRTQYADVFEGDEQWQRPRRSRRRALRVGRSFDVREESAVLRGHDDDAARRQADRRRARARACSATRSRPITSRPPARFPPRVPPGKWLIAHGVTTKDFNSYGARRGNHEVMMRGTFANIRLRNELAPGTEGGWTRD